jgi:predicted ArsR family transcriptional regulator
MSETQTEILELCRKQGGVAWLSSRYFTEEIAVRYDTVMKHLKILVEQGILEVKREGVFNQNLGRKGAWICWYRLKQPKRPDSQQTLIKHGVVI